MNFQLINCAAIQRQWEGYIFSKLISSLTKRRREQHFFPVTCLSIFQCQTPQLCSNSSSSYHPTLSVRAVSKMTIKRDTNTTNFKKKTKERPTHHFTQACKSSDPRCIALSVCYHNSHHMGITIDTRWLHLFYPHLDKKHKEREV